jgi:chemotaxis signal transduction protein
MSNQTFPPLDELIKEIDLKIDAFPDSYSLDEYESITESQRETSKRRGKQFLRFSINNVQFALPLKYALEILATPAVTPLPNLPGWILGISNVRGKIVSVVELIQLLNVKRTEFLPGSHLILLQIGQLQIGCLVDKIGGIFFDEDPEHVIKKKELTDKNFARFSQSTFIFSNYDVHLLEVARLLPALTAIH